MPGKLPCASAAASSSLQPFGNVLPQDSQVKVPCGASSSLLMASHSPPPGGNTVASLDPVIQRIHVEPHVEKLHAFAAVIEKHMGALRADLEQFLDGQPQQDGEAQ